MKKFKLALAILVAVPLAGCASSHLIVEQPSHAELRAGSAKLVYDDTTTGVSNSASTYVQKKMEAAFYGGDKPRFVRGEELTVKYHFVGFDKGSRVGRYMLGPLGVGEAQMILEAQFFDPSGTMVAVVRGQSAVRGGFFGGSANTAIDKSVKEIRDYAVEHFRR
ncbi:MAG: DUF4410 domain-containing protein [Allosphingosinicella sp.]